MKSAIEFEKDIERYLKSKLPDLPEHTIMEIATYVSDRAVLCFVDLMRDDAKSIKNASYRASYRTYRPSRDARADTMVVSDEIAFDTRAEAEQTINSLNDIVATYGCATVADLYDLVALTSDYTMSKYVWTKPFTNDCVLRTRSGYKLALPAANLEPSERRI